MAHKELDGIIGETKAEYGMEDFHIPAKTVQSRVKRHQLNPKHPGTPSPVMNIEETLVEICLAMCQTCKPLNCSKGLALVNSLIKDTVLEDALVKFKAKCHLVNTSSNPCILGPKYWSSFLKQNLHQLQSRQVQNFLKDRAKWSKYFYIRQMYKKSMRHLWMLV